MKPASGNKYKVIGVMSGTSLDGMDLCAVEFTFNKSWKFELIETATISYTKNWEDKLRKAPLLSGKKLIELNIDFGKLTAINIQQFIKKSSFKPDLIASHGHTVFHQPEKGFTYQIGDGNTIATTTKVKTIADFRTLDVSLGGQGAPLVPIGDKLLFSDFDYCLNLGGFSNISYEVNHKRVAYDICPVNIVLNELARQKGLNFDKDGKLGKAGKINEHLLNALNALPYYNAPYPKSLGKEWIDEVFNPILQKANISVEDKMRTVYEHIAIQMSKIGKKGTLLVTGGGAFNSFLIERMKAKTQLTVIIPDAKIIDFKEALIFAFLGVLRIRNEINCLSSVTGASKDASSGVIFTT